MTTQLLRSVIRKGSAVMILAGLLAFGAVGKAAAGNKPNNQPAPSRPAPAPSRPAPSRPAPAVSRPSPTISRPAPTTTTSRPSPGPSPYRPSPTTTIGGASHGPTTSGTTTTHGPTTGGITTGTATHGPTTGGTTTGGAATHGPTTGGTTGGHNANTGGTPGGHNLNNTGGTPGGHNLNNTGGTPGGHNLNNTGGTHNANFGSHSNIGNGFTPKGGHESVTHSGSAIRTRPNGHISDVHDNKRGMDVHHGLNGNRAIHIERPDHSRVFGERGRPGYVQRPYSYHGHDFGRRSYSYHGHEYSHFYHGYDYHGRHMDVYAPDHFYHPGFYGWAYHPWASPIRFGWGWGGSPWYGYYGGYFAPSPFYPSAAFWLTDYLIAQDLQTAYAAHQEAGEVDGAQSSGGGAPALTPEVKQEIADEVNGQIALENQEAQRNTQNQDIDPGSSGVARMLGDGHKHVFVVGSALDVTDSNQAECALSDGDVLALMSPPPPDATAADLVVLASKGGNECQKSNSVTVQVADLQEMQNRMRELIDTGLQELQNKQGKGGLPQAPPSAQAPPAPAQYAEIAPPADTNAGTEIQQQTQQADQAETDVNTEAAQSGTTQPQ